jgi:hypothetical protein
MWFNLLNEFKDKPDNQWKSDLIQNKYLRYDFLCKNIEITIYWINSDQSKLTYQSTYRVITPW